MCLAVHADGLDASHGVASLARRARSLRRDALLLRREASATSGENALVILWSVTTCGSVKAGTAATLLMEARPSSEWWPARPACKRQETGLVPSHAFPGERMVPADPLSRDQEAGSR